MVSFQRNSSCLKSICLFAYLAIWLFIPSTSYSQQYNLRNYSVSEGLAQSQVFSIVEDAQGFIWMGTRGGGISRFDGLQFKNYSSKDGLINDYIYDLKTDKQGNLWIATNSGISRFDGKKFKNFKLGNDSLNIAVYEMCFDKDSNLWLAADKNLYRIKNEKVICFSCENKINFNILSTVLIDHTNTLWAGDDNGLNKVIFTNNERTKGKIKTYAQMEGLKNIHVRSLYESKNKNILVATYGGGLFIFDGIKCKSLSGQFELKDKIIHKVIEDKNGDVWMATQDNGISRWKPSYSSLVYITKNEGLCNDHTSALLQDSWGNLWFGSSGGGVSRFSGQMFMHYNESAGVKGNYVFAVQMARDSSLWIGTMAKGVIHLKDGISKHYNLDSGFIDEKIKCIYEDRKGRMWFGTEGKGLWTKDTSGFFSISTKEGLSSNWIKSIAEDNLGILWIATAGGGLSTLDFDHRGLYNAKQIKSSLVPERINCLLKDGNKIWYGADLGQGAGLFYPPLKGGAMEGGQAGGGNNGFVIIKELKNITIRAIRKSKEFIWMATAGKGILRIIFKDEKFSLKYFNDKNGLTSNNIYLLEVDKEGNLWAGSENGIDKLVLSKNGDLQSVKHYERNEGFIGIETAQNAACKGVNGELWFGTISGLTKFNPNSVQKNNRAPKLLLSQMSLFYEALEKTRFATFLDKFGIPSSEIEFEYSENHLSFDFIGINHTNPERVMYQWKLEGFESDWSPLTIKSDATYPNIAPGNYIFKVKACNEDGVCNEQALEIPFTILPPYWQTLWFRLTMIIGSILMVTLIILFFVLRSRKRNKDLREKLLMEKNLLQLEQKALRLQMNPHFIFHALNSIQGLIVQKDEKTARNYLSKFSKLMRSILENSREQSITLETEIATLKNYLELEKFTRGNTFDFEVNCDSDIDQNDILIPPMLLQPFVENAIIHGFNGLDRRGRLNVKFQMKNGKLLCAVIDNGVGREKATNVKMQQESEHKSTALKVTQERLDMLNSGEKSLFIIDIKDENGNPAGTEIQILMGVN
jgi:ligand-binding sensor domain-containing protein